MGNILVMLEFYNCFIKIIQFEYNSNEVNFRNFYNNERELCNFKIKNKKPRTELMLGSGKSRKNSIMYKTLENYYGQNFDNNNCSFDRYADLIYSKQSYEYWYKGILFYDLIVEIENNINEYKGTISDLFRIQAKNKVAIFYYKTIDSIEQKYKNELPGIFKNIYNEGFSEFCETKYLIIFGPDYWENDNKLNLWKYITFTTKVATGGDITLFHSN